MGETTILRGMKPRSETQFRRIMAQAHRARGKSGDAAWAMMHEQTVEDIRRGVIPGDSLAVCPDCRKRGIKTLTIEIGGHYQCGTCGWHESSDATQ